MPEDLNRPESKGKSGDPKQQHGDWDRHVEGSKPGRPPGDLGIDPGAEVETCDEDGPARDAKGSVNPQGPLQTRNPPAPLRNSEGD